MVGEIAALSAALLWSVSSYIFMAVLKMMGTQHVNFARLLLASIFLIITILFLDINFNMSYSQVLFLSASGIVGLLVGDFYLFKSFTEIGPRFSMLLASFNPAMASVLAFFLLGEGLTMLNIFGMIIALSGISLVVLEKNIHIDTQFKITRKGIFYGFMAAVGQAVGLILAKYAFIESPVDSMAATLIRIGSSAIVLGVFLLFTGKLKNPVKIYFRDRKIFYLLILVSIMGPYLGITLSFIAITKTQVGIAATLLSTNPIIMLPLSYVIYKEKLSWKAIVGAVLTVFGVGMLFFN
jgi:drug/metabolite transporter (DMT)-like permease